MQSSHALPFIPNLVRNLVLRLVTPPQQSNGVIDSPMALIFLKSILKWMVLGQSGRSEGVKVDDSKVRKWTIMYETGGLKVDGPKIQKWGVLTQDSWADMGKTNQESWGLKLDYLNNGSTKHTRNYSRKTCFSIVQARTCFSSPFTAIFKLSEKIFWSSTLLVVVIKSLKLTFRPWDDWE